MVKTLLSLPRVQVQSLVRELKSHKPHVVAKKREIEKFLLYAYKRTEN